MAFDPGRRYRLNSQVAIRREPFGAVAYHYGNRRLMFIGSEKLLDLVEDLKRYDTAAEAIAVSSGSPRSERALTEALSKLERSGMIDAG